MELDHGLKWLNLLAPADAERELLKCCGSSEWAKQLTAARPISTIEELTRKATSIWWSLDEADWLEAFHSHPKIGEKEAADPVSSEAHRWSEQEQSATQNAARATLQELRELNRAYEERFGYIFIICATGKNSEDILGNLRERLNNSPGKELRIGAEEQNQITQLRLGKLLRAVEQVTTEPGLKAQSE